MAAAPKPPPPVPPKLKDGLSLLLLEVEAGEPPPKVNDGVPALPPVAANEEDAVGAFVVVPKLNEGVPLVDAGVAGFAEDEPKEKDGAAEAAPEDLLGSEDPKENGGAGELLGTEDSLEVVVALRVEDADAGLLPNENVGVAGVDGPAEAAGAPKEKEGADELTAAGISVFAAPKLKLGVP